MSQANDKLHPKRARTIQAITTALPGTKTQIAVSSGLNRATVIKLMPELHEAGQVHIGAWRPHPLHGPSMAVYHAGPGEDALDTLPRLTRKEIVERYEKRIKGTEKFDQRRAKQRSRHWVRKAAAAPQSWMSALMQQG